MEAGFLIESKFPVRWIAGKIEPSVLGGIKARDWERRQVESQCCVGCGFLELYARASIG